MTDRYTLPAAWMGALLLLAPAGQAASQETHVQPEQQEQLSVNLEVSPRGTFFPDDGSLELSGTMLCSIPSMATVSGELIQQAGRGVLRAPFEVEFPCDGVTPWSVVFSSPLNGRFAGGPAEVLATGIATPLDGSGSGFESDAFRVLLRGRR